MVAERNFRRLDPPELLRQVALGANYENGVRVAEEKNETEDEEAAA